MNTHQHSPSSPSTSKRRRSSRRKSDPTRFTPSSSSAFPRASSQKTQETRPGFEYPTPSQMITEVKEYMSQLAACCTPATLRESPRGFEGVVLEPVEMRFKDRHTNGSASQDYQRVTLEYSGYLDETRRFISTRNVFCRGLVENPDTRALALLAVGPIGVQKMEQGQAPSGLFIRSAASDFNRHHIVQKSAEPLDGRPMNHFSNLVLIDTGATGEWRSKKPGNKGYDPVLDPQSESYDPVKAQRPDLNAHHLYHGALLVSQTDPPTGTPEVNTVFCPRPIFPIFPPLASHHASMQGREEVYKTLESLEPGLTRKLSPDFNSWADKLVAFSESCHHKPYRVPEIYHEATMDYTHIYHNPKLGKRERKSLTPEEVKKFDTQVEAQRDQRRSAIAGRHALTTASLLPLEALVNGRPVAQILSEAQLQGIPIRHTPIPQVPLGWKPVKNLPKSFPCVDKVRQNMIEAGLEDHVPHLSSSRRQAAIRTK